MGLAGSFRMLVIVRLCDVITQKTAVLTCIIVDIWWKDELIVSVRKWLISGERAFTALFFDELL
jgi:hypothetical protein